MAPTFRYSHPTTPAGTGFDTDLGSVVPWGSISGLVTMAAAGEVGISTIYIDDPNGSLDIKGLHRFRMVESEASTDPVWNGYINEQAVGRMGAVEEFSGGTAARSWELTLSDDNAILGFRVVWDTDGNRSAESGSARLAWLISTNYLGDVVDDGYVTYPSGTALMDATDYRGQYGRDVLADIALQNGGVNYFAQYDLSTSGTSQSIGLWFGDSNTSTAFTSTLSISNALGSADGTAIFYPSVDTVLRRDPSRIAAGVFLPYNGGSLYTYDYATSYEFAFRDQVAPTATITSQAQATALADQFLATFDEQDERISTRIWVPPANLYDVRAGHRLQATFTHLPGYETPRWMRVTQKSISNFDTSMGLYEIGLELSPQTQTPGLWSSFTDWHTGGPAYDEWPAGVPPDYAVLISFVTSRAASATRFYYDMGTWDAGNSQIYADHHATSTADASYKHAGDLYNTWCELFTHEAANEPSGWYAEEASGASDKTQIHCMGWTGLASTPDATNERTDVAWSSGSLNSGTVTCSGPGLLVAGFIHGATFGLTPTMAAVAPAVDLGVESAQGAFPPTPMSLLTYLVVATAGDYSIEVTTNGDETYGVCAAFYPAA